MSLESLKLGSKVTLLPIIHGSGDFAVEVRRVLLSSDFDCLAVPLPPSFQPDVERAIEHLPGITVVVQDEPLEFSDEPWRSEHASAKRRASYVPIDPCQGVIAALRIAVQEHRARAFVDLETSDYLPITAALPDPYALKKVPADKFAAAVLPAVRRLPAGQPQARCAAMAARLRELESRYRSILLVCSVLEWPWIREAYVERIEPPVADEQVEPTMIHAVAEETLMFLLGELPYVTGLYEQARRDLGDDENLSIDGIKEMLLAARDQYRAELKSRARPITPHMLSNYFQYVRNLALVERRMTPDLFTLVLAAQQIAGDTFAVHLAETAKRYPFVDALPFPKLKMGIDRVQRPDGLMVTMKNRLPGHPRQWRTCRLAPRPPAGKQREWAMRWNPFAQCSWPPEDSAIERFRTHVKDAALAIMGADLARSEKFSTSLKDGLDIRETLRNWHTGDLYVKVFPPTRGNVDCVVMLFDSPADPREYPWRITWHAEHHDESTLCLFATDFRDDIVGPGIARATYGGAVFLFPPRSIPDVWRDSRFDFTDTLEERLLAAACHYSEQRHIALLSAAPPGAGWRRLARRCGKKLVHLPLSRFSQATIDQLRSFHVLNGQQIRSYAAHFIHKA